MEAHKGRHVRNNNIRELKHDLFPEMSSHSKVKLNTDAIERRFREKFCRDIVYGIVNDMPQFKSIKVNDAKKKTAVKYSTSNWIA